MGDRGQPSLPEELRRLAALALPIHTGVQIGEEVIRLSPTGLQRFIRGGDGKLRYITLGVRAPDGPAPRSAPSGTPVRVLPAPRLNRKARLAAAARARRSRSRA